MKELLKYPNYSIFPHIIGKNLTSLIKNADLYLDINYGGNDQNVINRVEEKEIPVITFADTADRESDYSNYHVFDDDQVDEMVDFIKNKN